MPVIVGTVVSEDTREFIVVVHREGCTPSGFDWETESDGVVFILRNALADGFIVRVEGCACN